MKRIICFLILFIGVISYASAQAQVFPNYSNSSRNYNLHENRGNDYNLHENRGNDYNRYDNNHYKNNYGNRYKNSHGNRYKNSHGNRYQDNYYPQRGHRFDRPKNNYQGRGKHGSSTFRRHNRR